MTQQKALVINFFAGPGAGKSTMAAGLFEKLKWAGVNCELVTEYAKDRVWQKDFGVFECQQYVFGKQLLRIQRLVDKVDVIITDSPLLLSAFYDNTGLKTFKPNVIETFNQFDNVNYFISRRKKYNPKGRMQTEEQSKGIDNDVEKILNEYNINYQIVPGVEEQILILRDQILEKLEKNVD